MEKYNYYAALLTATPTEEAAVMRMFDWTPMEIEGDDQVYCATVIEREGKPLKIVTARQSEMGMPAAGVLAMKIISLFRPQYVIMVGIAAGVAHRKQVDQFYGDIVIPDIVWDYSSGKFVSAKRGSVSFGEVGFISRPRSVHTDEDLLAVVKQAAASEENEYHIHIGPMACGATVVANSEIVDKQIHAQYGDTAALDMESYAVMYAAVHATTPKPKGLIIKSVCDYADEEKSDQYQKFAAFTSSQFAKLLLTSFLPD